MLSNHREIPELKSNDPDIVAAGLFLLIEQCVARYGRVMLTHGGQVEPRLYLDLPSGFLFSIEVRLEKGPHA